jgi:DNA-directed RNA polymerase beta subunit
MQTNNPIEILRKQLLGSHPLRNDMSYENIDLLFLHIAKNFAGIASLITCYNSLIWSVRNFASRMTEFKKYVSIQPMVKYDGRGQVIYSEKSHYAPNVFLREKGVHQRISIAGKKIDGSFEDIILIPFMFGCEFCITSGLNPEQLHAIGEDAGYSGGFFIKDGSPKFILAHEKVSHNLIMSTFEAGTTNLTTSLKTQDDKNNSIELCVVKSSKKEERGLYLLKSTCFNSEMTIEVINVIKQIYVLLARGTAFVPHNEKETYLSSMCCKSSLVAFIDDLVEMVCSDLKDYIIFDPKDLELSDRNDVLVAKGETMQKALIELFSSDDIRAAHTTGSHLISLEYYPQLVVECIFPSIKNFEKKALVLMKMLCQFRLVEQKTIRPSNRDDLGNKSYLNSAELFRKDLTKNSGERLGSKFSNKIYEPTATVETGDSEVFESLEIGNPLKMLSQITTLSTPMSNHSRCVEVRAIHSSHIQHKCVKQTPSGPKLGLITHMAIHCCMTRAHNRNDIENLILSIVKKPKNVKGEKTLCVNSIPFTTANANELELIKSSLKKSPRYYDVAFAPEIYMVNNEVRVLGYNILHDGGRLYSPLFTTEKLNELKANNVDLNAFISGKSLEKLIAEGLIEMVAAIEMSYYVIAERWNSDLTGKHYALMHQSSIYGLTGSCAPMLNHNPGGRAIHETSMAMSALTMGSTNMPSLSETSSKLLLTTEKPVVSTLYNELFSNYFANGVMTTMALVIRQDNNEDAFACSSNFAKSIITQRNHTVEIEIGQGIKIGVPETITLNNRAKYHAIHSDTNLPIKGTRLKFGDCIFAMYQVIKTQVSRDEGMIEENEIVNLSKFVERNHEGFISKIKIINDTNGITRYRITISFFCSIQRGDKFATRYSQKGVIGGIINDNKLPVVIEGRNKGLVPEMYYSPMSVTSRATPGVSLEMFLSNYGILTNKTINATSFTMNMDRLKQIADELGSLDTRLADNEFFETIQYPDGTIAKVFIFPVYVRPLVQTSYEKLKACSIIAHSKNKLTRQATRGSEIGGIQEGDMELNTLASHSATELIHRLYSSQSDEVTVVICHSCGHYNDKLGIVTDMTTDYTNIKCARCKEKNLRRTETNYGAIRLYYQGLTAGSRVAYFPL